jgi:DNA polymerase-4
MDGVEEENRIPRKVVLKLKASEFKIRTRSQTPTASPTSCEELTSIALGLREKAGLDPKQRFRLVGVGLSNFEECETESLQTGLFS